MTNIVKRVVAEAALARRYKTEIEERASKADISELTEAADTANGAPYTSPIAFDTDGVPYITIGESE